MKTAILLIGLVIAACDMRPYIYTIPEIEYPSNDISGVMRWVAEWVEYQPEGFDLEIASPSTTYETRIANCEAAVTLAMYLLRRDLGQDSKMAVFRVAGGLHTLVLVDGDLWEPLVGLRVRYAPPLWIWTYEEVMALAGAE